MPSFSLSFLSGHTALTPYYTISLWWNSVSYGAAAPRPLFSRTSRSTRWLSVYPCLPMLCSRRGRWLEQRSSSVKVVTFG